MDLFAIGYAMGLVVAEGSFTGDRTQPSLELKTHRRDLEPLEHLRKTLGGRIFGPYVHSGRHRYAYMLRGQELRAALPIIQQHLPPSWKRLQFDAWRLKYSEYFERPVPSRDLLNRVRRRLTPQGG